MCDIEIYNINIEITEIPINLYFSFDFFFSSFSRLSIPALEKPALSTNFSTCSNVNLVSSYSILALFIIRLTEAAIIPSCLFKYFSSPDEHALHVIPSIFNNTFFIFILFLSQGYDSIATEHRQNYNYFSALNPASSISIIICFSDTFSLS